MAGDVIAVFTFILLDTSVKTLVKDSNKSSVENSVKTLVEDSVSTSVSTLVKDSVKDSAKAHTAFLCHKDTHTTMPTLEGANPYIMPTGHPHGMIPGQYQTPMGQFVGQNQPGFASGTRLGGGRGRRRSAYMEPYQEGGFSRSRRRR
ncbi:hypothetical protein DTO207G8_5298 [Paecilomyces variotii]|nr:hypothetical protein DTO169C6_7672 [Paecilomyces variotii]KAJ9251618.1 hypothetical protein DTO207G8_5298 [Paecilomyces variotii]KAJ9383869.1 hypothetical protein DTO063F5_4973 [Paecilomyces variotii]